MFGKSSQKLFSCDPSHDSTFQANNSLQGSERSCRCCCCVVVDVVARVLAAAVVVVVVAVVPRSCAGALIDSVLTVAAVVPYVEGVAV